MMSRSAIIVLALTALGSCAPSTASKGGFNADDPTSKLNAILRAGHARDQSVVGDLVEQLDSDDPLIRMMAINALQRITGDRLGYNPYASVVERQPAIDRWAQLVRKRRHDNQTSRP